MGLVIRTVAAAIAVSFFVTPIARAQQLPMSDRQKAEIAQQKAAAKATDDAYEAAMKRSHGIKPKTVDPWANLRAPSSGGGN